MLINVGHRHKNLHMEHYRSFVDRKILFSLLLFHMISNIVSTRRPSNWTLNSIEETFYRFFIKTLLFCFLRERLKDFSLLKIDFIGLFSFSSTGFHFSHFITESRAIKKSLKFPRSCGPRSFIHENWFRISGLLPFRAWKISRWRIDFRKMFFLLIGALAGAGRLQVIYGGTARHSSGRSFHCQPMRGDP